MAWTAPKTYTAAVLSVSEMNTYQRDNLRLVPHLLYEMHANKGNTGGGADELFASGSGHTLPANTLATAGDRLRVMAWISFAATGNTKTVVLSFKGTAIATISSTYNNVGCLLIASITRVDSTNARTRTSFAVDGVANIIKGTDVSSMDYTTTIALSLTGESGGSADNDVILSPYTVEVMPAQS